MGCGSAYFFLSEPLKSQAVTETVKKTKQNKTSRSYTLQDISEPLPKKEDPPSPRWAVIFFRKSLFIFALTSQISVDAPTSKGQGRLQLSLGSQRISFYKS